MVAVRHALYDDRVGRLAVEKNLPAFLAVLLPVIGFHGLATTLVQLPSLVLDIAGMLALTGCLYSSIRALAQSRPGSVTAYGSLSFHSILWWYLVRTADAGSATLVYVSAVGLATSREQDPTEVPDRDDLPSGGEHE